MYMHKNAHELGFSTIMLYYIILSLVEEMSRVLKKLY